MAEGAPRPGEAVQLEVSLGEDCGAACAYCPTPKDGPARADERAALAAIKEFLRDPARGPRTVTFTSMEPLRRPGLWARLAGAALAEADALGREIRVAATTAGQAADPSAARLLAREGGRVRLGVSLDGAAARHEALRGGSRARALSFVRALPPSARRAFCTLVPADGGRAGDMLRSLARAGLRRFDVFPDPFAAWTAPALEAACASAAEAVEELCARGLAREWRLLNRLWGPSQHSKAYWGADGAFYAYEWASLLPFRRRGSLRLGRRWDEAARRRRAGLLEELLEECFRRARGLGADAAWATPLLLLCRESGEDPRAQLAGYARLAEAWRGVARRVPAAAAAPGERARLGAGS